VRYFVVTDPTELPVAVVFHDYRDQVLYCRSKKESFLRAFNAVCARSGIEFVKEDAVLRAVQHGPEDYDWMGLILDQVCEDYWSVSDIGEVRHTEVSVDAVIQRYLAP